MLPTVADCVLQTENFQSTYVTEYWVWMLGTVAKIPLSRPASHIGMLDLSPSSAYSFSFLLTYKLEDSSDASCTWVPDAHAGDQY